MTRPPYLPRNCTMTLWDLFPRIETYEGRKRYYIRTSINSRPPHEIRMTVEQQRFIDDLLARDGKLLQAIILVQEGKFTLLRSSPQGDFFNLVKEAT